MLDVRSDAGPPPPKVLVGSFGAAPAVLLNGLTFLPCSVLRQGPEESVEELIRTHRPAAVFLDAGEAYLHGRALVSRLQDCAPEVRILFLDLDDTWALWMEYEPEGENDVCVTPCRSWEASHQALVILREAPPRGSRSSSEEGPAESAAA